MQARIEKALFAVARRLDQNRQLKRQSDEFRVNAAIWQRRAGVPRALLAVGGAEGKPLPAVLLGVRLGTCDLSFQTRLDGHPANMTVAMAVTVATAVTVKAAVRLAHTASMPGRARCSTSRTASPVYLQTRLICKVE
jgi:hypothetical protein